MKTRIAEATAYVTKDASTIRELMHPAVHGGRNQSLAEAVVEPGQATHLHLHRLSEEIYHVLEGHGEMTLGERRFGIEPGDTVLIPPQTPHRMVNSGSVPLRVLCCCAPPYSHADTERVTE